jgi:serine/threonine-protein kinase HipA
MSRKQQRLAIWMNGIKVGYWEKSKGVDSLQYLPDWSADEQGRPLSLSLPFTPGNQVWRGNVVRDYFDNLLRTAKAYADVWQCVTRPIAWSLLIC